MNSAFLIGVVVTPATTTDQAVRFTVGIPEKRSGATSLQQVAVIVPRRLIDAARELRTAQPVYVDGRLERSVFGAVVEARTLFAIGEPPPPPVPSVRAMVGTHASPRPHDRGGHLRRIHRATAQERVVWVRPTRVGDSRRLPG